MRSIRPQTVTLAVVAILLGLVAAYAARRYLESKPVVAPPPPVAAAPQTASVAVAQTNLLPGTRIRSQDVATVQVPKTEVPVGAVPIAQRAIGRVLKTTVVAGHVVCDNDLYPPDKGPTLADALPPGQRAMTLHVDESSVSVGSLMPDSYVDVSLTFKNPDGSGMVTERILERLKVLASPRPVSDVVQTIPTGGKAAVTVAVTPDQANRLILAQQFGTLSVTLCSSEEGVSSSADNSSHLIDKYDLLGLTRPSPEPPPVRKVAEVYRGTQLSYLVFDEGGRLLSLGAEAKAAAKAATAGGKEGADCPTCKKKGDTGTSSEGGKGGVLKPRTPSGEKRPTRAVPGADRTSDASNQAGIEATQPDDDVS
jgi:pilus assembly protein CpaB